MRISLIFMLMILGGCKLTLPKYSDEPRLAMSPVLFGPTSNNNAGTHRDTELSSQENCLKLAVVLEQENITTTEHNDPQAIVVEFTLSKENSDVNKSFECYYKIRDS